LSADVLTLFDLDNTLVPQDSERAWVDFLIAERKLDAGDVNLRSADLTERYNRGEAGAIEFTEFYLGLLTRFEPAELAALQSRFVRERVRPRITPAARLLVERHRDAGDVMVITTAVFDSLARREAAEFGIEEVIATEEERVDGRVTGRVAGIANSREGKVERLREWLAERGRRLDAFREIWVYADSVNDLPLLSHATRPVVVNPDPMLSVHARHAGWPILMLG
jgi:HAD superfamily hydrolase (TIGR01490 family)